ncbi:MAG TPA: radical SAM peptide maturase [Williamwhitmania sp.]|nr:radical SAM peptide maturase [Williamwhitmania sp.]
MEARRQKIDISSHIYYDLTRGSYRKKRGSTRDFIELQPTAVKDALVNTPQITFEITDACNLECRYCGYGAYYNFYDKRESKMLELGKAIRFLNFMMELWNSELNNSFGQKVYIGFYGGEPLLNMSFIEGVVDYIGQNKCSNRDFVFSMTTNAMLLDRYVDYLQAHDFHLLISLDGGELNNSYRVNKKGQGVFERVVKNVEILRSKYPAYFNDRVNFNSVLHNRNSVAEIYNYFRDNYGKLPSIGELNNVGIRPDIVEEFNKAYRNAYESLHQSENYEVIEKEMFLRLGSSQSRAFFLQQNSGYSYNNYLDLLFEKKKAGRIPTGTCLPFSNKVFITVNGKILPCERVGHRFALGYISEDEVTIDYEAIAIRYNGYYAKLKQQCSTCYNVDGCVQCIFNLADIESQPICFGHMDNKSFSEYATHHIDYLRTNPEEYYKILEELIID